MAAKVDYIAELDALAIASRLRRLLHRLISDAEQVYKNLNIDFKPKWFPIFHLLANRGPLFLGEIAQSLHIAHPSVIDTVNELARLGLVTSRQSETDRRCRELSLSRKGKRLYDRLWPVWESFRVACEEVIKEGGNDFLKSIGRLECALDNRSMYQRIMRHFEKQDERKIKQHKRK